MTLFLIARGYPTPQDPQWGCFEKDQAKALVQAGHQLIILSVDSRFRFYWRPLGIRFSMCNNIPAYNIFLCPDAILSLLFGKRLSERFRAWQLDKIYQRAVAKYGKPDILYSHYLLSTTPATYIHQKYNIPLIGIEHWSEMGKNPIKPNILSKAKYTYQHIDQLLTVSSALQKNILTQLHIPSLVVNNIVGSEFTYVPLITPHTGIRLVTTGSLLPVKGHDILFQALSRIPDSVQWELLVIGAGKRLPQLQQLADTLRISKHIQFCGKKNKQEIVQIYRTCDIYVSASRSETFGVAITEALACGLPAISTDCGGPRDIITPVNGLLVPTENPAALAEAIQKMSASFSRYDRQAIADDCQARFSPQVIARQLTDIFQQVLTARAAD